MQNVCIDKDVKHITVLWTVSHPILKKRLNNAFWCKGGYPDMMTWCNKEMLVVNFDWRLETSKVKNNTKQKLLAIDET